MLNQMKLFILLFLMVSPSVKALTEDCKSALTELFQSKVSHSQASEFLKLQGDITMHRLAWGYLKAQKELPGQQIQSIESTILSLLEQKYHNTDPEFIKAREAFEKQPLSRAALADISPYLKDLFAQEFPESDTAFKINASDIKLLHSLSKYERSHALNGKYNDRLLAGTSSLSVLNFLKIINSSYSKDPTESEEAFQVDIKLKGMERHLGQMQNKLNTFLNTLTVPVNCVNEASPNCAPYANMAQFFREEESTQNLWWSILQDKIQGDNTLMSNLKYGKIWLRVPLSQEIKSEVKSEVKTNVKSNLKSYEIKKPQVDYNSHSGVKIVDPSLIIANDKVGRVAGDWKKMDSKYQKAFADAIVNNEKVFMVDGKIYLRANGKSFTPGKSSITDPYQIVAVINGKKTYVKNEKLYDINGKELSPAKIIADIQTKKIGQARTEKNYTGLNPIFLTQWAEAATNTKPYFTNNEKVYDTLTGRAINSPLRGLSSVSDVKLDKQKRILYEKLPDQEIIINFNRDQVNKGTCGFYTIIDKVNSELSVYSMGGEEVFKTEVLLGTYRLDQRTRWETFNQAGKENQTNYSTGAGTYQWTENMQLENIAQPNLPNVFGISPVPKNMEKLNEHFGTGNPNDRRTTAGGAKLSAIDYKKLNQWMKPGCKVYVLPEEKDHHFMIKNGHLNFVNSGKVKDNEFYNFNKTSEVLPINIKITSPVGNTKASQDFVNALESEKAKLMEIFKLDNDDYNDLAMVAYAMMGNESKFGTSTWLLVKEFDQTDVVLMRALKKIVKGKKIDDSIYNTSRGYTQIKNLPLDKLKKDYPEVTKESLMIPKNSAVATIAYLSEAMGMLKNLKNENGEKIKVTKEHMVELLGYVITGRSAELKKEGTPTSAQKYINQLNKNMTYIEVSQSGVAHE